MNNCCESRPICCHCNSPFTPDKRLCTDPGEDEPRIFEEEDRDCFWPIFTHPRWLCCRTLYGCRQEDPC